MNRKILLSFILFAFSLPMQSALADDDDNPAAEYREKVMETIGSSFGGFIQVYLGKVKQSDAHLVANTKALAAASSLVGDLVPAGSEGGDAKANIWEEMDTYQKYAKESANATAQLAAAAETGDRAAMGKAFKAVGNSCKACHDKFREED